MNVWWWQTIDSITTMVLSGMKIAGVVYLWSHEYYWGAALLLCLTAYANSPIPKWAKEQPEKKQEAKNG